MRVPNEGASDLVSSGSSGSSRASNRALAPTTPEQIARQRCRAGACRAGAGRCRAGASDLVGAAPAGASDLVSSLRRQVPVTWLGGDLMARWEDSGTTPAAPPQRHRPSGGAGQVPVTWLGGDLMAALRGAGPRTRQHLPSLADRSVCHAHSASCPNTPWSKSPRAPCTAGCC
jgi:hypothetical protein